MADEETQTNVVQFPRKYVGVAPKVTNFDAMKLNKELQFADELTDGIMVSMIHNMDENDIETAALVFSEILKIEPDNISAKSLLARCLIKNDQLNDAEKIIDSLPVGAESNQDYISVRSELEIFKNAKNNPISHNEEQELRNNIDKQPENYQLRLDLSKILMAKGENEEAINQLLRIIEVNPKWNDGEARKQLIEIFNILGNENTGTIQVDGGVGIAKNLTVKENLHVAEYFLALYYSYNQGR